jgi:hypothetical protein
MLTIEKPKLPKGFSYALKTSMLVGALESRGIESTIHLVYWKPQSGGSVLEAHYWMPNARISNRRVYIRAGCISSSERKAAQEQLSMIALPSFVNWLHHLNSLPDSSSLLVQSPYFEATFVDGQLKVSFRPTA